jgi:hypothetical protein
MIAKELKPALHNLPEDKLKYLLDQGEHYVVRSEV